MTFRRNPLAIALTGLAFAAPAAQARPVSKASWGAAAAERPADARVDWASVAGSAALATVVAVGLAQRRAHELDPSSASVRGSRRRRPSWIRPTRAGRWRGAWRRAAPGRRRSRRRARGARVAAARRRRPWRSTRRLRRGRRRGVLRALAASRRRGEHRKTGMSRGGWGRGRGGASPRARRARACRGAGRGRAGGAWRRRPRARADHDPGLRAAEELVAGEAGQGRPGLDRAADGRLVGEDREVLGEVAGADVVDHGHASSHSSSISTSWTKPSWRKFDGWARRIAPVRSASACS